MFSTPKIRLVTAAMVFAAVYSPARGFDSVDKPVERSFLIPRKSSRWQDRASQFVQKNPKLVLIDGDKMVSPGEVGSIYKMERADGDKLLLLNRTSSLQGWASATDVVHLTEADAFFSLEIQANPKSSFAHLMRGIVRYECDDLDHALADADEALRLDPKYAKAWAFRAFCWQWKNRLDKAMADVNKAIELDLQYSGAFVERGFFHYIQRRYDDSLNDLDQASALGSRNIDIEFCRGSIDLERGDLENAEAKFDHILEIDPNRQDACCQIAAIHEKKLEPDKALSAFNRAIQIDPKYPYCYRERAVFLVSRFEYEKALDDLNEAIKLEPRCAQFYLDRLSVWLVKADFDRAVADVETAIRLDPDDADAQLGRASILAACPVARIRNGDQAVVSATRACELTQWKDPESLGLLAAAKSETGDFDGAVRWQMKAIEYLDLGDPEEKAYRDILACYNAKKPYHSVGKFMEMGLRPDVKKP